MRNRLVVVVALAALAIGGAVAFGGEAPSVSPLSREEVQNAEKVAESLLSRGYSVAAPLYDRSGRVKLGDVYAMPCQPVRPECKSGDYHSRSTSEDPNVYVWRGRVHVLEGRPETNTAGLAPRNYYMEVPEPLRGFGRMSEADQSKLLDVMPGVEVSFDDLAKAPRGQAIEVKTYLGLARAELSRGTSFLG